MIRFAIGLCFLVLVSPWVLAAPQPELSDPALPLVPKQPRSEQQADQVHSAALFTHGRLLLNRGDYAGALRRYQRAYRYSGGSTTILNEIVSLAFSSELDRQAEAARYAVILAETDPRDPVLLRRLAIHLTGQGDIARALRLYEKALKLQDNNKPDASLVFTHLEMGRLYFLLGKNVKSAASMAVVRDALEHPGRFGLDESKRKLILGNSNVTYSLLGEIFLAGQRWDEAAAMFNKSFHGKINQGLLAFHLARVEKGRGTAQAALELLEEYLRAKLSSAGSGPYRLLDQLLEKIHSAEGKDQAWPHVQQRLAQLYQDDPANAPLGYYLAEKYRQHDALDRAEPIYAELLKLQPALAGYRGLIHIYHQGQQVEKLLDLLGQTVATTGTLQPLGKEAEALAKDAKLVDQLIELARRRKEHSPPPLDRGQAMAAALLAARSKRFDAADEFFAAALPKEKSRKAQALLSWGLEMFMADQYQRAARIFQQAIDEKVVPEDNGGFAFYLAGALEMAGQTDKALAVARQAARQFKTARFDSREAWILYHAKRYDEARDRYRALVKKWAAGHKSPDAREVVHDARMVLSTICVIGNQLGQAEQWLEQILDEYPEDIGAQNDLGYLWADQGKHLQRSLRMVTVAAKEEPDNIAYRDSLGWALYRVGRHQEAVKQLEKAAGGEDADGIILDHLGDAYLKLGQQEKALASWQKAAEALNSEQDERKLKAVREKIEKYSE